MTYTITKSIASDTANSALNIGDLDLELAADPTVAADDFRGIHHLDASDDILIIFGAEPPQAVKDAVDAVCTAHQGAQAVSTRFVESTKLLPGEMSITETTNWETVNGTVTNASHFAGNALAAVVGQVNGQIKTDGADCEIQVVHDDGTTETVVGTYTCPDTAGAWQVFEFLTGPPPAGGLACYKAQARKNTTANFDIRWSTVSMFLVKNL